MKPWVFAPEECLRHEPGDHPESPGRLAAVLKLLAADGTPARPAASRLADEEDLALIHDPEYVRRIRAFAAAGGGRLDPDTVASAGSFPAALAAAGAVLSACDAVAVGETRRAFCAVRPPGHHALRAASLGFCLFNNVAIGARHLRQRQGAERVLIVDFDVHHGNGTEQAFAADESVFYYSIHRFPFWPGTGGPDSTAAVANRNDPLPAETAPAEYHARFADSLARIEAAFAPDFVMISAGFDALAGDPVGGLNLRPVDFHDLTRTVVELAERRAGGRVISVLEGGYAIADLPVCVAAHLAALGG